MSLPAESQMDQDARAHGASFASPEGSALSYVLLDYRAYIVARSNASTARSKTSRGHPIEVTFCTQRPPVLSYFSVNCSGLERWQGPGNSTVLPKAIASDADLVLLRIPVEQVGVCYSCDSDYFVYRAHQQQPSLDLLPSPPHMFGDSQIAILSLTDEKQYVVAALEIMSGKYDFLLYLYRSKLDGDGGQGSWTCQEVSLDEPIRKAIYQMHKHDKADWLVYHLTNKVITLGGPRGTIGWVDLWGGILLCDVLEETPRLRDMPFPLPAKGNWNLFLDDTAEYYRDVTVNQRKDCIKYVEMEIIEPRRVTCIAQDACDPNSYLETRRLVPGYWKLTTWSMPIPVGTWNQWHRDYTINSANLRVDVCPRDYRLLQKLSSSSHMDKASEATLSLGSLLMGYPTLSMDDDVVYLLTKRFSLGIDKIGVMTAVNVKRNTLQGAAKLDTGRNTYFRRYCIGTGISKYLKAATTGTIKSLGQIEEHTKKAASIWSRKKHACPDEKNIVEE